jgi:hypothetical protein
MRHAEGALIPNTEGTESKNTVGLSGDELKITGSDNAGSSVVSVYRRAK